jgi:hypothetical protein
MKKALGWFALICVILYIGFNPDPASAVAESLGGTIGEMARGFGQFFTKLLT